MNADLDAAIRDVIAGSLRMPLDQMVPGASITDDLGADSLLHMTVIMDLERRFAITIPDAEAARCTTVHDVVAVVRRRITR
ncbi:MAG: acyl carrier protein [Pirellulales bacterium]